MGISVAGGSDEDMSGDQGMENRSFGFDLGCTRDIEISERDNLVVTGGMGERSFNLGGGTTFSAGIRDASTHGHLVSACTNDPGSTGSDIVTVAMGTGEDSIMLGLGGIMSCSNIGGMGMVAGEGMEIGERQRRLREGRGQRGKTRSGPLS